MIRGGGKDPLGHWIFGKDAAWLVPLIRKRRFALAGLFGLGLVAAGMALVPPWLTKLVIDRGLVGGDTDELIHWSLALFGVGLFSLGLGALSSVLHMRASVEMLADLRLLLARTVLDHSAAWRAEHRTGELLARLDGDTGEVQQFAFNALLSGSGAIVRLVGGAVLLFVLSWELSLIACILAPLELAFFALARPRTERLARRTRAERGALAATLTEMLAGLTQIQSASGESAIVSAIGQNQSRLNAALIRAQLWGEVTRNVPLVLTAAMRGIVFLIGGLMVIRDGWPLGSLIAFIAYLGFLVGPMQTLIGLWHAQVRMRVAMDRLGAVMSEDRIAWPSDPAPLPQGNGQLALEAVRIAAGGKVLLSGIDARIEAGAKIRIGGPSGTGKSQLLSLLQRHADPAGGTIRLDGIDLRKLGKSALRSAILLVPQRPFVMRATVAENLRLGCPDATASALDDVLDAVKLGERCPLDAILGEDGLTLSGGERQRLAIARALLARPRVLVLDEAFSEIEPELAASIMRHIDGMRPCPTRLIVTHGGASNLGPFDETICLTQWQTRR